MVFVIRKERALNLTEEEWDVMPTFVAALTPLKHLAITLGGEKYPTINLVAPRLSHMLARVPAAAGEGKSLQDVFVKALFNGTYKRLSLQTVMFVPHRCCP